MDAVEYFTDKHELNYNSFDCVFDIDAVIAAASEKVVDWTDSDSEVIEPTSPAPIILVTDCSEELKQKNESKESDEGGFTLVDFTVPTREKPLSHPGVDPPICEKCRYLELSFFDPTCPGCREILLNPKTSISEIFAIMRQWVPQTQQNIDILIKEILRRGAHVDDKDGLTDMTMLHYACKAGAVGVGEVDTACNVVQMLLGKGSKIDQKCRWTDMLPLHYATFFDVGPLVKILLEGSGAKDTDTASKEFDNGTPLHIAATNLCVDAAQVLLRFGANIFFKDALGRTPLQCVPDATSFDPGSEAAVSCMKLRALFEEAEETCLSAPVRKESLSLATLRALGLAIGDRVTVADKVGVLRFCGSTDFASGQWAGIELDEPVGKNDGSVAGVRYFSCQPNYGLFAPLSKISSVDSSGNRKSLQSNLRQEPNRDTTNDKEYSESQELKVGERVLVAGQKYGTVRFAGPTKFASGNWIGVELDQPAGKNDGSVAGVRYFSCKTNYGVFAPPSKVQRSDENGDRSINNNHAFEEKPSVNVSRDSPDGSPRSGTTRTVTSPSHIPVAVGGKVRRGSVDSNDQGDKLANGSKYTTRSSNTPSVGKSSPEANNGPKSRVNRSPSNSSVSSISRRSKEPSRSPKHSDFRLREGMSVYVNSELGIVRFIGRVDFSDGVWLGVELRKPNGKNDGSVGERRYFSCKSYHGLMVRPSKATCRGINCSQLIGDR